jgi:hypothetical protein
MTFRSHEFSSARTVSGVTSSLGHDFTIALMWHGRAQDVLGHFFFKHSKVKLGVHHQFTEM